VLPAVYNAPAHWLQAGPATYQVNEFRGLADKLLNGTLTSTDSGRALPKCPDELSGFSLKGSEETWTSPHWTNCYR